MSMPNSRKGAEKTKVELVRLDNVSMDEDDEILPDFEAEVDDGRRVWVTAVLERTAVIEPAPGEPKVLVNRRRLFVNPLHLRVRHLASKEAARRGREAARQLRLQEQQSSAAYAAYPSSAGRSPSGIIRCCRTLDACYFRCR